MKSNARTGGNLFNIINGTVLILLCVSIVIPFYFVFTGTLVTEKEYLNSNGFVLWPQDITFDAYRMFFRDTFGVLNGYIISILRVVIGTSLNILFTSCLAYVLSKKWLPGRNAIMTMVFITMNFGGGLIPSFVLNKTLGLYNTFFVMVIPGLIGSFFMVILRNFFSQVPLELEESARMDGAGELTIMFRVIMPLSLASIATISLFYAVGHWNAWFDASIYLIDNKLYPLQLILRKIVVRSDFTVENPQLAGVSAFAELLKKPSSYAVKNTAIFFTTLPILCVYPFAQKYFVKGVLTGSIKG